MHGAEAGRCQGPDTGVSLADRGAHAGCPGCHVCVWSQYTAVSVAPCGGQHRGSLFVLRVSTCSHSSGCAVPPACCGAAAAAAAAASVWSRRSQSGGRKSVAAACGWRAPVGGRVGQIVTPINERARRSVCVLPGARGCCCNPSARPLTGALMARGSHRLSLEGRARDQAELVAIRVRHDEQLQSKRLLIESRWVSKPLAFAGKLRPRRLNN
jgi:hypothetical protein